MEIPDKAAVRAVFAENLRGLLVEKGLRLQVAYPLARAMRADWKKYAALYGKPLPPCERALYGWLAGKTIPTPTAMHNLADFLDCEEDDLMPALWLAHYWGR